MLIPLSHCGLNYWSEKLIWPEHIENCFSSTRECLQVKLAYNGDLPSLQNRNFNFKYIDPKYNLTSLMVSSQEGHINAVKYILHWGGKGTINWKERNGWTALMMACFSNRIEVVKLLLEEGADVNMQDDSKRTALMLAVNKGHLSITKCLLNYQANAMHRDIWNVNVLSLSVFGVYHCHTDILLQLLCAKDYSSYYLNQALQYAIQNCCFMETACLIAHGATVTPSLRKYVGYNISRSAVTAKLRLLISQFSDVSKQICHQCEGMK